MTSDDVVDALAFGVTPVTPRPGLRRRVLAAARASRPAPHLLFVARDATRWTPVAPGMDRKPLAGGPGDRTRTFLLRLAAGGRLPAHVHDTAEHLLVVSGTFVQDGRSVSTGDYMYSPVGSSHAEAVTAAGCVVLVVQVAMDPNAEATS